MKRLWLAVITLAAATAAQAQTNPYYYPRPAMGPATAQPGPAPGAYGAAPQRPALPDFAAAAPDQILRSGLDRLEGFLARGQASPEETQAFLEKEISPFFDFDYMARWAGGALYAQMDDNQKAQFAGKLEGLFFSALARNLGAYTDPKPEVEVFPARAKGYGREVTVTARVTPQGQGRGAYPVRLEFRFYPSRTGWKIFDVTANGTSAVAYYRTFFNDVARRGSIEACCR
jgi:phospholipid transport system substrate-binding protein